MSGPDSGETRITPPTLRKTQEWITALAAAGFPYRLEREDGRWSVYVAQRHAGDALAEIDAYERVNRNWPPRARRGAAVLRRPVHQTWSAAWVCLFLAGFYAWLGPYAPGNSVLALAAADARRMMAGDWWRAVTALTVHSDVPHLLSNMVSLGLLGHAVCRAFGGGLGWAMILAAAAAGNLAAAAAAAGEHVSVGASTASFAALGILAADEVVRKLTRFGFSRTAWARSWIPVGAGIAMLSMIGTAPSTDVRGHALGLLCGMLAGLPFSLAGTRWLPQGAQPVLQILCLCAVMLAWAAPLSAM